MANTKLRRLVGLEFGYKIELQTFFTSVLANKLVQEYNQTGNTPASRTALYNKFVECGPSMGFSAKKYAYGVLELIIQALVNNPDVPTNPYKNSLNTRLVDVSRYVGIAGEGDFHFMVAVYKLSEVLSSIMDNVTPVGPILTLTLTAQGTGYTKNGAGTGTATGVVFNAILAPANQPDPSQYVAAKVIGDISSGNVTTITSVSSGGNGFAVGSIVSLTVDTAYAEQSGGTGSGATATVNTIG
jgi:hypothetical protein